MITVASRTATAHMRPAATDIQGDLYAIRRQNSSSAGKRLFASLPAIRPALMAPIEVPMIQSGSMPPSCSA